MNEFLKFLLYGVGFVVFFVLIWWVYCFFLWLEDELKNNDM